MELLKIFNLKKFLSVTVTLSLLLSAVPFNAQASSTTQNDILFNNTSIVKTNYGTVSDYVDIGSNITVINIQDLHCHLQTQRNINNILKDIDKAYPIDMLFVEGGYDNINFDTIDNISDKSFRTKIINKMLENGSLTGAEYFVLTNNKENILKGLDEKKLHEENLSKLAKIINKQELYSQIIKNISEEIKILNKKFLNKKNIQFSKILEKYKNGKISTGKFYKILLKYANESNKKQTFENILPLFVADYPNISNYLNISNINSDINLKKLNTQFQKFLSAVKQDLNYKEYKKLTDETNNFSDVFVFSDFITKYCEDKNIILKSNYSEIEKFVKDIKLKQNINPAKLLYEEQQLIKNVRLSLADDYTEYEISCISDLFTYFEKYLTYSLTAYEWQYFKENFDIFRKIYSKYSVADSTKNIENDFSLINSYYNINEERNNIFLEKIGRRLEGWKAGRSATTNINNRDPKEIIKGSNKIIVVVAGGFHSQDLKNELTAKKINSITIMPNITTETDTAKTEYENYVQMQNKMLSQALALRIFLSAPTYEQKIVFAKASLELLPEITKENLQTLEKILNIKIDILGDERYKFSFINTHGKRSEIIIDRIETTPEERKQINTEKNNISEIIDSVVLKLPTNTLKNISISDLGQIIRTVSLSKFNLFPLIEGIQPQAVENEEEFEPGKGNKIFEEIKERIDKDVPTKIAFVCLGNINRSAVAEVLFKSFLSKEDKNNIDVVSAGIDPRTPDGRSLDGKYSDPLNALKDIIDPDAMRNFKSESFGQKHLNSDYIIVASDDIRNIILKTHPEAKDRIIVFKEIVPDMSDRSSILDLTDDKFRAQLLVDLLKQFFEKFFEKRENEFKKMRENIKENIKNFFPSKQSFSKFYDKEDSDEPTPQKRFVSYKTKINKSFKMKIPQEIIDALHLDDGEEFYITRLKNNTLVVSKREEQLEELSNIFIRDKKSFRDKYLAQHIVYPRTYDVVLDKNNTVNMRKHYDPKILRTPLTEEEMSDINLYYDTRESLILEEKTEEKKKRTSILRNRSYFNRARLTILAPKISSLRYLTLYRNILEKTYKITANILRNFGFKDKRPYFDIIYNSTNKKFLLSVINNRKKKIKYRLFAYMYLKTMKERNVIEDFEEFEDTLKLDFINYLKININKKRTFIKNNFDLRAVATGIFLLEDYFVEKERDRKEIYKKISKSIFVREGSTGIADEGMNFVSAHPLTIAHEIGHNILNTFGFTGYSKEETTLHELFADVIANCFGFEVGIEKNTTGYVLYGLFDNRCNEKIFQEEHEAARGFINLLKARSKAILDKEVSWQDLADAILDYVTNDRFLTERKKQIKSQKEILEDLFSEYFEKLYNNRTINDRDIAKLNRFMSENKSSFSLIKNILDEIKNYRFQDYFDILNVLRKELPIPYSYWEENKIKRKNSFSRFTNRTSKEEIDEFISSVILAQPDLKRDILKIIRDKLLLKEKFSYKIMLLLISIDTLENTNSLLTEKDVYFEIAETIKFLPKKDYYTLEDYQHISDYAFLFQDSVVADIINYTKRNYPILYPYIEQEIKNIINFSLNYRFNRKISLYIKANDIVSFIKNRISKQQSFKNEDIVMLLYMETLLGDIKDLLFKRHKLDNKVFNLVNNLNLDKQYYTKYAYEQILDYCNDNHLLSADYRIKILNFLGITDFQKQQEIISVWEYPQIILGIFFPKIRERFKNSHSKDIEEKLSVLENDTAEKIREIFNLSVEEIKEFSFFNKIITVGKILINFYIQTYNRIRHLELNGANIPQTEIDVFYEDFFEKFSDISIDEKMKILVATDTENFNQKDLINTGLKVNGNTIWQVRNADKILIFVADNATISDIAETLNGYKNLNKQIKKLARLKNLIRINSFIFKNGKITPLKDTNKPVENELSTERLQTNIDASFYINILATA